jgi:hypothetical protein
MAKKSAIRISVVGALLAAAPVLAQTSADTAAIAGRDSTIAQPAVVAATPQHSEAMDRLVQASERLREAVRGLAAQPPGPQREGAITTARRALMETEQAMVQLPPELRSHLGAMSEADYASTMDKLEQAADRLHEAAQAMARQPAGDRRNEAIAQVNDAILEANHAMVQLPWENRAASAGIGTIGAPGIGGTPGSVPSGTVGSSGSEPLFDRLDTNKDGVISREEFSRFERER